MDGVTMMPPFGLQKPVLKPKNEIPGQRHIEFLDCFTTQRFNVAVWLVHWVGNDWTASTPAHLLVSRLHMVSKLKALLKWKFVFKTRRHGLFDNVFE